MMADFEDIRVKVYGLGDEPGLHGSFHIAGQEERPGFVLDPKGQRIVIDGLGGREIRWRREDLDTSA